ncbi:MAG: hypothetical protein P8020_20155 [Acidobacteriota bacterium]
MASGHGAPLNTIFTVNDFGSVVSATNPRGYTSTYDYTDSWYGSNCLPSANSHAYVNEITNPLGQRTRFSYYPCTGLKRSVKDEKQILAGSAGTISSYDLLGRVT